ncbi:MAG TPA: NUDIX domain-containing protein [Flavobacterium sp.]|nr:NUDIX domain-containing protein [Flavobacterium sp.]
MNKEGLREIERIIGSTVIFSSDGKILMGRKDPAKGGVYADAWHLPGGGTEEGETPIQAAVRETNEEILGLNLTEADLVPLPSGDKHEAPKIQNGEKVWCKMTFHRFEVHLPQPASEYGYLQPGTDFVELGWFTETEQAALKQAAGKTNVFKMTRKV